MRSPIIFGIGAAIILAGAASCERNGAQQDFTSPLISISPSITGTRSILHPGDEAGKIQIYDYAVNAGGTESLHINDTATGDGTGANWVFTDNNDGAGYPWVAVTEEAGSQTIDRLGHHFFSWLLEDGSGVKASDLFGTGLSYSTGKVLTVPTTTMTPASAQFDFCYSDMIVRAAGKSDYSTVRMPLHHLFTCFGIKAYNYTTSKITITSAKISNLVNNKGAAITYDTTADTVIVSYGTGSTKLSATELVGSDIDMAANTGVANIITSSAAGSHASSETDAFFLMWPQTAAELDIPTGTVTSSDAVLTLKYKVNGGTEITKTIPLRPASWADENGKNNTTGWDAGTRHQLELAFTDAEVGLTATVMPWDLYTPTIDYDSSIQLKEDGELTFIGDGSTCTVDTTSRRVYFKGGNPITATFALDAPIAATWMISMKGDFESFELDNTAVGTFGDKVNNNTGTIDGNAVRFTIYPRVTDPDADRTITLSFSVRCANGNVYSVDDLVQGDTAKKPYYTIVLQAS